MSTINSKHKGKGHGKEHGIRTLRGREHVVGTRLVDRTEWAEVTLQTISEPGIDRKGEVGVDICELFAELGDELQVGWMSLPTFLRTTRVDCYPE